MAKFSSDRVDEDVKVRSKEYGSGGLIYSHPSYGMIRVSRFTGGKCEFFGSEITNNGGVSITIEEAEVTQSLGKNWYYGNKVVTQVDMSPVQYAEMISNPNTQGMPCTIKYRQDKGYIQYKGIDTQTEYIETEISEKVKKLEDDVDTLVKRQAAILSQKGTLKKADKEELLRIAQKLQGTLKSGLPFYLDSLKEAVEYTKVEAKADMESYAASMIHRTGLEVLKNPEKVEKLLEIGND